MRSVFVQLTLNKRARIATYLVSGKPSTLDNSLINGNVADRKNVYVNTYKRMLLIR